MEKDCRTIGRREILLGCCQCFGKYFRNKGQVSWEAEGTVVAGPGDAKAQVTKLVGDRGAWASRPFPRA